MRNLFLLMVFEDGEGRLAGYTGFDWDGVGFLHSIRHGAGLSGCGPNSAESTGMVLPPSVQGGLGELGRFLLGTVGDGE